MKIIIAPDSFKGALRAPEVAQILSAAWRRIRPSDEVLAIPLSDGGEGLSSALFSARGGKFVEIATCDALFREITGKAVLIDDFAVLESAEANGIERLLTSELNPLSATSFGVGVMLKKLLDLGCREFIIGIGGSATVDGGAGMLQALGVKFFDQWGNELPAGIGGGDLRNVAKIDLSGLDERIFASRVQAACDVTNVLCGPAGSAAVFGPQKGATPEMVSSLDANLHHFAVLSGDPGEVPGDGAAGGMGYALRKFLGAKLVSGASLVMEKSGFLAALPGSSLVITGEGCSDEQTAYGKLCSKVAEAAAAEGVPTVLLSGALRGDTAVLEKLFCGTFSISPGAVTLDEAIGGTRKNLARMGANLAGLATVFSRKF